MGGNLETQAYVHFRQNNVFGTDENVGTSTKELSTKTIRRNLDKLNASSYGLSKDTFAVAKKVTKMWLDRWDKTGDGSIDTYKELRTFLNTIGSTDSKTSITNEQDKIILADENTNNQISVRKVAYVLNESKEELQKINEASQVDFHNLPKKVGETIEVFLRESMFVKPKEDYKKVLSDLIQDKVLIQPAVHLTLLSRDPGFSSGYLIKLPDGTNIAGGNEHTILCRNSVGSDILPIEFTTMGKQWYENISAYKYKFCLPHQKSDVAFAFNNLEPLKEFLKERSLNAPSQEDFEKLILSGAKSKINTYRKPEDQVGLGGEYSETPREITVYPTNSQLVSERGRALIQFSLNANDFKSGSSGSPGIVGENPNYLVVHSAGYEQKYSKVGFLYDEKANTYKQVSQGTKGALTFTEFAKKEYEKAKEMHPELKSVPFETIMEKGSIVSSVPMTKELYEDFLKNGFTISEESPQNPYY